MSKYYVPLIELYLCETYLTRGYTPYVADKAIHVPAKKKTEYVVDMKLVWNRSSHKWYTEEPERIFKFYKARYETELHNLSITSYEQLVYKMRESRL